MLPLTVMNIKSREPVKNWPSAASIASCALRTVVGCALYVVGKAKQARADRERALSRVLSRTVESGAWRVMRKIETLAALTREK